MTFVLYFVNCGGGGYYQSLVTDINNNRKSNKCTIYNKKENIQVLLYCYMYFFLNRTIPCRGFQTLG